ncbi:hypothetical protein P9112_014171 [Eukaryota sp. TZLM1-RC]
MSKLKLAQTVCDSSFWEYDVSSTVDMRASLGAYPAFQEGEVETMEDIQWLKEYVEIKLSAYGHQPSRENKLLKVAGSLLGHFASRLSVAGVPHLPPADLRVQTFLRRELQDESITIPSTVILDRYGMARLCSFPPDANEYKNSLVHSYRTMQGVLQNPTTAARTTKGTFHVAEGGQSLPIPGEKVVVPQPVYKNLLHAALQPPDELLELPYDSNVKTWVSLYLRPVSVPGVQGVAPTKRMEVRVLLPGSAIAILDFLESIFGNAGDPFMAVNDAGIDHSWSGHTGMIICAPHIRKLKKKDLGLPHYDDATETQRQQGMCWQNEDELYRDGGAFNLWYRTKEGVAVTIITDSYFGYYKKTVKAFLSFASNLSFSEEEHAGGCIAFASYNLGNSFELKESQAAHWDNGMTLNDVLELLKDHVEMTDKGYAIDKKFPDTIYVHHTSIFSVHGLKIRFIDDNGNNREIKLLRGKTYVLPCGYRVFLSSERKTLVGQSPRGIFAHKPASVSGSGKSEISKPITNQIIRKAFWVGNLDQDLDNVYSIVTHDYSTRFRKGFEKSDDRSFLSSRRSLGSAIKLLTPSVEFNDAYNKWLGSIPTHVRALAFLVKQIARKGEDWKQRFSIQMINGTAGHELYIDEAPVIANYLRVGFDSKGEWKLFRCRADMEPAGKIAMEDDISTSVVVPLRAMNTSTLCDDIHSHAHIKGAISVKMATNCEYRFFQRPDDAIIPGLDRDAERDIAQEPVLRDFVHAQEEDASYNVSPPRTNQCVPNPKAQLFACNFNPLTPIDAVDLLEDCITFDKFTEPMKRAIALASRLPEDNHWVCSAKPRLVPDAEGVMKPTKNPRYLQTRPDLVSRKGRYLTEISARLSSKIALEHPVNIPVGAVIIGRRCNNSAGGVRSMSCYNPIHWQELPEAMAELMACLTGKSPSTTGAGVEGAMTKAPFNALLAAADLNAAFLGVVLTGTDLFSSCAGYCGENIRVDHDITFLIPELWSRMTTEERTSDYLLENNFLEKLDDFKDDSGNMVYASRLGYRINRAFSNVFLGRLFDSPHKVFSDEMLYPELQNKAKFIDSVKNICEAQQRVCQVYINDGTVNDLVPPLATLCRIIAAGGEHEGITMHSEEFREMFKKDNVLNSDWYKQRLCNMLKVEKETTQKIMENTHAYKNQFIQDVVKEIDIDRRIASLEEHMARLNEILDPISHYYGYIGVDSSLV